MLTFWYIVDIEPERPVKWQWSFLKVVLIDKSDRYNLVQEVLIHKHYLEKTCLLHGHAIKQLTVYTAGYCTLL